MVFHEFEPGHADLDMKPGDLYADGIWGFKLVSWFEANPQSGLPELFGTSLLFDIHTGAAAAVGTKYLARPEPYTLLMAGTGSLAPYAIAATLLECPNLERVILSNPHHPQKAKDRLADIWARVSELFQNADNHHCHAFPNAISAGRMDQARNTYQLPWCRHDRRAGESSLSSR